MDIWFVFTFHFLPVLNSAAIKYVYSCLSVLSSLLWRYIPRNRVVGTCGNSLFSVLCLILYFDLLSGKFLNY